MTQIWDPMQHTVTQTDTIHVRSFRRLVMQTGGIDLTAYAGRGELEVRCGLLNRHWCGTPVDYKLTTIHYCSPALLVWSHLYVRPSGATSWRELPHYHDAVMGDCP